MDIHASIVSGFVTDESRTEGERVTSYLSGPFSSSPGSIYGVQLVVGDGDDDIHHNHPVIIGQRASVTFLAV
jgi:hypothetical protein